MLAAAARRVRAAIERVCAAAAVALGGTIFLLMLGGIAGRHVFSDGLPALTELPEQLFPWWVAVSVVLAARHGAHVAVQALSLALPVAARRLLRVLGLFCALLLSAGIVWTLFGVAAIAGGDRSPILGLPLLHMHAALGLAFGAIGALALCELASPECAA